MVEDSAVVVEMEVVAEMAEDLAAGKEEEMVADLVEGMVAEMAADSAEGMGQPKYS